LAGIPICVLLVVLVVLVLFLFRSGIHVSIQNTGSQPLRSVVLFVTGTRHNLGDIPPDPASCGPVAMTTICWPSSSVRLGNRRLGDLLRQQQLIDERICPAADLTHDPLAVERDAKVADAHFPQRVVHDIPGFVHAPGVLHRKQRWSRKDEAFAVTGIASDFQRHAQGSDASWTSSGLN
jgi:hypothetical protein